MKLNKYQELAGRTANKDIKHKENLANYSMGLAGETGEVVDILKKVIFHNHVLNKEELKDELGDVLWYLTNLATELDLNLQDIAEHNIDKLKKRYPDGFSEERSRNRDEKYGNFITKGSSCG